MVTFSLVIRSREQSLLCPSMASSTMFRGRRIVDPIPVQRGPLPREGKYRSSFSGNISNPTVVSLTNMSYFHFCFPLKVI